MDILLQNLNINTINEELLWKIDDSKLYNKHTQYIIADIVKIKDDILKTQDNIAKTQNDIVKTKDDIVNIEKNIVKTEDDKKITKEDPSPTIIVKNSKILDDKTKEQKQITKIITTKDKKNKKPNETVSPIDIIIKYTNSNIIIKEHIKMRLIETIGRKDYIKIFGVKKSSEIMTALTKEKWNQSICLFISFMIKRNILYKEKEFTFYKDKTLELVRI